MAEHGENLSPEELRRYGHQVVDWIADYLAAIRELPVNPAVEPGGLKRRLPAAAPEQGEPMESILEDFRSLILPHVTHWNHPRFFGYFAVSASGPGILAEMLTAALNANGMLWKTNPAGTELEEVTLGWLRQWLGLPAEFFGMIHDTASTSTLHAVLAARQRAAPETRTAGAPSGLVLYTSEQAHSSVEKGALAAGIGRDHVRLIPVDTAFRMHPQALEAAILEDLAARRKPFCAVATVGTTSTTSVDPVPQIAALARRYGLWLHVDAAYGGAAAILPEFRHLLAGAEHADSLVVNPHKWLFTPVDLSAFYTRHPGVLRDTFSLIPEYLRSTDGEAVNFMDYGVPLGRRFRALKLWFVLRYFGREGVCGILRRHIEWAAWLAAEIAAHPLFEVAAPAPLSTVCFRLKAPDPVNERLLAEINRTTGALLSHTKVAGLYTLRFAIGQVDTQKSDIKEVWLRIQEIGERLTGEAAVEPAEGRPVTGFKSDA